MHFVIQHNFFAQWQSSYFLNTDLLAFHGGVFSILADQLQLFSGLNNHMIEYQEKFQQKTSPHKSDHGWPGFWNKRFPFDELEVLPRSFLLIPCSITGKFTTAEAKLLALLLPGCERNRHLSLRRVWKATQQRSPWAVPGRTEHAQALTNSPLAATSVHRPAPQRYCWKYNTQHSKCSTTTQFQDIDILAQHKCSNPHTTSGI